MYFDNSEVDPKRRGKDKKLLEDFTECDKRVRNFMNEVND